jgi:hypothetical protein
MGGLFCLNWFFSETCLSNQAKADRKNKGASDIDAPLISDLTTEQMLPDALNK